MSSLALIYARSRNHCIGKDGKIPWHLPRDFAHFKRTTMGCPVIMGRKTYEDHKSVLPGRTNLLVTRQRNYQAVPGMVICHSLDAALAHTTEHDKVFIIGGVDFFSQCFELADEVYETIVDVDLDSGTYLPPFDFTGWQSQQLEVSPVDDRHAYSFQVLRHLRQA